MFASKIIPLKLSDLGEGTKEATIKKWYKREGEIVKEEENILEVETDKLVAEIPSPSKGKIHKCYYDVNETCLVGKSLCDIIVEDELSDTSTKDIVSTSIKENIDNKNLTKDNELDYSKILATPAVRHLIKKHNINVESLKPSGRNNRILKEDVLAFIQGKKEEKVKIPEIPVKSDISTQPQAIKGDEIIRMTGFKKAMVKSMTQSANIPSFLFTDEFNVDKLIKLRKELNNLDNKIKITYMPFIIKAVSLALEKYSILNSHTNSQLDNEGYITEYIIKKDHNISIAIDGPDGLVVPNIKRVQDKTIIQIQKELNTLREKAENRKLTNDDLKDGTFTISNIGNIGGKVLSPMIFPPQTCIIGVSKFFDSLTVMDKNTEVSEYQAYHLLENKDLLLVFHKTVNICLSADHRVIDGATVARFSNLFRSYLENPLKIWISN